jgi:hypothetical protein
MASPLYLTMLAGPVAAVPVPKPLTDAFVSAEITESATGPSGFQLVFTLADDSILQTFFLLTGSSPIPVLRVILMVTFGGLPQVIMDGIVEHHEVSPDATQGSSKLVISGHDLSALMDLVPFDGLPYPATSPNERVQAILAKYGAFGILGEVVEVPTPDRAVPAERVWAQKGTDLGYIQQLAKEAGYVFYMTPGPLPGTSQAYWGPQFKFGIPQPALNVNMDSWTNVENLTFRYEPRNSVSPTVYIQSPTLGAIVEVPIPPVTPLNPPLGAIVPTPQRVTKLKDTAKRSTAEAMMLGIAEAVQNADVVTGNGTLDVDRYGQILRARSLVGVRGAGLAFDGMHYVDSVTHNLKLGEYKQTFVLKRNALVPNLPVVPALPY